MAPIKHLLSAASLSESEIRHFLAVARAFGPYIKRGEGIPLLQGKTIVNLFFETSTRTSSSFDIANRRLGGNTLNFSAASSSVQKGETLIDTARTIQAMRPHGLVVRHSSAGSPVTLAGDGFHEHPTQALLDAFTIEENLGKIAGKRVVILGDIAHSRVARSNIHVLKKLGASVAVCGPPTLLPPRPESLGVDYAYRPEELLPRADVVMALRIQLERQNRMQIPSLAEYSKVWGLNRDRAKLLKKDAIILHPGPINRGVEIDPEVADAKHSLILDQVANGVLIRMAVLATLCGGDKLDEWLKKGGHVA
jgi:aspartate carbamoyltransferase catalytic subunit